MFPPVAAVKDRAHGADGIPLARIGIVELYSIQMRCRSAVLLGPGVTTVFGVENESIAARYPAGVGIGEMNRVKRVCPMEVMLSPGAAAIAGTDEGAEIAHCPTLVCVEEEQIAKICTLRDRILPVPAGLG